MRMCESFSDNDSLQFDCLFQFPLSIGHLAVQILKKEKRQQWLLFFFVSAANVDRTRDLQIFSIPAS
jgi:hypothetical protein